MQSSTDFGDVVFANAQGFGIGMNGVVTRHELVRVLDGRAEDEASIRECFKLDRLVAPLEHDDFAGRYTLRVATIPWWEAIQATSWPLGG